MFKEKYKSSNKTFSPAALAKIQNYTWPGNIRQLQHSIERAFLFSGKDDEINIEHVKLENEPSDSTIDKYKPTDVLPLAEMEKRLIFAALKKTNNHKTQAAELLGITVRTLRNKLHLFEQQKADL